MNKSSESTKREQYQELIDEARLAETLNDCSIDQILALDLDMRIIAWNKVCERITGIPKKKAMGSLFTDVLPAALDAPSVMEAIRMAYKGSKSFVPWEKGSYNGGYFENHFIPLRDESDGMVTGVLNIIHDVAHRIKAEKDLQVLNRALVLKNNELKQKKQKSLRILITSSRMI